MSEPAAIDLARIIIARLNALIVNPSIRADVSNLMHARVSFTKATEDDPRIQPARRPLGIVPTIPFSKPRNASPSSPTWGFITAVMDDADELVRFELTEGS